MTGPNNTLLDPQTLHDPIALDVDDADDADDDDDDDDDNVAAGENSLQVNSMIKWLVI
jgi:hypothetical protein